MKLKFEKRENKDIISTFDIVLMKNERSIMDHH